MNSSSGNSNYHQGYGHAHGHGHGYGSGEYSEGYNEAGYGYSGGGGGGDMGSASASMDNYGNMDMQYGQAMGTRMGQGMQIPMDQQHYGHETVDMNMGMNMDMNMDMGINMGMDANMNVNADSEVQVPPGAYYPFTLPFMPHIQKAPISAIAIDPIADALHVAGHTIQLNPHHHRKRNLYGSGPGLGLGLGLGDSIGAGGIGGDVGGGGAGNLMNTTTSSDQRVSMMATHNFSNGDIYAACAAHDEANRTVLQNLISCTFGINTNTNTNNTASKTTTTTTTTAPQQMKIPAHAYRPPYQIPTENDATSSALSAVPGMNHMNKKYHMGVSKILPFCAPRGNSQNSNERKDDGNNNLDGYNFTVSPSAIRVHTRGGMQLSNNDQIQGMVSCTFHPNGHGDHTTLDDDDLDERTIASTATHVTIGGTSTGNNNNRNRNRNRSNNMGYNLHCIDLYSDSLKPVASHAVRSDTTTRCTSTTKQQHNNQLCISSLATNHPTCNIIAGCSDGTLRIFDGRWRGGNYMECAKVKAHGGGVVNVATAGNFICTTGYSSTNSNSNTNMNIKSSSLYAFPDEHVLVFDIRFLGRGGIVHPFSGLKGGPRHISFIPGLSNSSGEKNHRILVASGQAGGGLQIITPFDSLTSSSDIGSSANHHDFINLPLDAGEAMTAMSVMGRDMAVGTNYGNVHQYRMAGYEQVITSSNSRTSSSGSASKSKSNMSASTAAWSPRHSRGLGVGGAFAVEADTDAATSTTAVNDNTMLEKEDLFAPTYTEPPPLSIEPQVLQGGDANYNSRFISVFNAYNLHSNPVITPTFTYTHGHGHDQEEGRYELNPYSFGPLSSDTFVPSCKKSLSKTLKDHVTETTKEGDDFLTSIQTSKIGLNLVGSGRSTNTKKGNNNTFMNVNMNKLLYGGDKIANVAYDTTDPRKKGRKGQGRDGVSIYVFFFTFDICAFISGVELRLQLQLPLFAHTYIYMYSMREPIFFLGVCP